MSPRYVVNLVTHLPSGSAYYAARMGGPEYRGWSIEQWALAQMVDTLKTFQWFYVSAHIDRKKSRLPKAPEPFPRPQDKKLKKNANKPGSFAQMVIQAKKAAMRQQQEGR